VHITRPVKEENVATPERRYGGVTVGGIIVIVGIVLVIVAFGGVAGGTWY
jgi:hypothetical protein